MFFSFFRKTKPFHEATIAVSGGHQVYYAQYGNPKGEPVLCFHGGPGSYSKPKHAELFDLKNMRVIVFDQRGGGKSTPAGETDHNTASDLIHDAASILDHLGLDKTNVFGGSWGSTLALLYAQQFPDRVKKLLLTQIFLARQQDIDWIAKGSGMFYPDLMAELKKHVPAHKTLRQYYAEKILSDDLEDKIHSTRLYGSYEYMIGTLDPKFTDAMPDDAHLQSYKIYMHYDSHDYGVQENEILDHIDRIRHIPTVIVHNRLDMVCPVQQAWDLHQAMPNSTLVIVPDSGHGSDKLKAAVKGQAVELFK